MCKDQFLYYHLMAPGGCDIFIGDLIYGTSPHCWNRSSELLLLTFGAILKFRVLLHPLDTVLPEASWRWKRVKFRTQKFGPYNFALTKVLNWLTFTPLLIDGFAFGQIFCDLSLQCKVFPERLQLIQNKKQMKHIIQELSSTQVTLKLEMNENDLNLQIYPYLV